MLINNPAVATKSELQTLLDKGWRITSDGESGTQLTGPKKFRPLDFTALITGAALLPFITILGAGLIIAALLDYFLLVKSPTKFLPRQKISLAESP